MSTETFSEVSKTILLDFAQKTSPVTVFAKQGDNNTRVILIQPMLNGVRVNIDTGAQYVAKFAAKKPDGHFVYNDSASINDDGTITVMLTDQTLAAHGNAVCCVILETQSGETMTSQNFTLIIEYSAGAYKNLASTDEILGLDEKLQQVQELIDKLSAEGKILPAATETDKGKVLTVDENGDAVWDDAQGMEVFEVASHEDINADSPDGIYLEPIEEEESGTGGTTIHVYDSLEAAAAANLPDGSYVAVPSTGGGVTLPVVELETVVTTEGVALSETDAAKMDALNGGLCIMKVTIDYDESETTVEGVTTIVSNFELGNSYALSAIVTTVAVGYADGAWRASILN